MSVTKTTCPDCQSGRRGRGGDVRLARGGPRERTQEENA